MEPEVSTGKTEHRARFNALLMGFTLDKVPVWFMSEGIHDSYVEPMLTVR